MNDIKIGDDVTVLDLVRAPKFVMKMWKVDKKSAPKLVLWKFSKFSDGVDKKQ